jgi:glycosyltransferase involved in cell wall biosynthesis
MKILMMIDTIDIGGAETHLVNLVQVLNENNVECFVTSSGGIYEETLLKDEIPHLKLNVKSKNPVNIIKIIIILIKFVNKNNIDIIHSHGRMPAFIGSVVSKLTNTRFLTTAHAKVEVKSFYKYITTYGECVISVSDDIKNHIINKFNVSDKKIKIIPNGINIKKFKKESPDNELIEKLGLNFNTNKIMIVSRMDGKLGQLAIDLVMNYKKIKSIKPLEIIVVGDGERFEEIKEVANKDNNVKILGKRSDINKILNISDVIVAVSRSALEAMAAEKLVVLAGGEGYLGLFNEKMVDEGIKDNFTGRNCNGEYSIKLVIEDIEKALYLLGSNEEKKLTKFSRELICTKYSLNISVMDTIEIYKDLLGGRYDKK